MSDRASTPAHTLPLAEAARWLDVDLAALQSLVRAGYLTPIDGELPLAEVKAFVARNAEGGIGVSLGKAAERSDPDALIDALDARVGELARTAYERFAREIPQALQWSDRQRQNFIEQAKGRLAAVLAVTGHGAELDSALRHELETVGANAAWAGSSLPHLLLVLRISRDLLLGSAMQIADQRGGRLNATLLAFSTRMLPVIDHLADALSDGYWGAKLQLQQEQWHRLFNVIEASSYAVYEADVDGVVRYANAAFATLVGRPDEDLEGVALGDLLKPSGQTSSIAMLLAEPPNDRAHLSISLQSAHGAVEVYEVEMAVRRVSGEAVGFGAILHKVVTATERSDTTSLVRHIEELRRSLDILEDAGRFLEDHGIEMTSNQVVQAGESVRRQAGRMMVILDELDADRRSL